MFEDFKPKQETERIIDWLKEIFKEKGFSKAVIGISGGIDSAVVASLCVLALGKENIYGYLLPYVNQQDIDDSYIVANFLGINHETIDIGDIVNPYFRINNMNNIQKGNFKARARMMILYDKAKEHNALVVGTSNKTEMVLGYFTRHGDGAVDLESIAHLYLPANRKQ